jgi:hypothetical protein
MYSANPSVSQSEYFKLSFLNIAYSNDCDTHIRNAGTILVTCTKYSSLQSESSLSGSFEVNLWCNVRFT